MLPACKTTRSAVDGQESVEQTVAAKLLEEAVTHRGEDRSVAQTLAAALAFLDDTQVREREGGDACESDATFGAKGEPRACYAAVTFSEPGVRLKIRLNPSPRYIDPACAPDLMASLKSGRRCFKWLRNVPGEWASTLHLAPALIGFGDHRNIRTLFAVQDSNVFMTTAVAYPLYLFDERRLTVSSRFVSRMRSLALENVGRYRQGAAYRFWNDRDPQDEATSRMAGPGNLPMAVVDSLLAAKLAQGPTLQEYWTGTGEITSGAAATWLTSLARGEGSSLGGGVAFALPPDAGDTAIVVAIQQLGDAFDRKGAVPEDGLNALEQFRDKGRGSGEPRDAWQRESGAYLTWLAPEAKAPSAAFPIQSPAGGVIPLGRNSVDCVVNADVVLAQSLANQRSAQGFPAAVSLLVRAVNLKKWPECGIYHPQRMAFPYAVTRAYRDGGLDSEPQLNAAMGHLLHDLLDEQQEDGSFTGGLDTTRDLATALGVSALFNIGREIAREAGVLSRYMLAIQNGIDYLVKQRKIHTLQHADTFDGMGRNLSRGREIGAKWEDGLFFAVGFGDFAHLRSSSYTTAAVVEALAKYLLAYEYGDVNVRKGRRLVILAYPDPVGAWSSGFRYQVDAQNE